MFPAHLSAFPLHVWLLLRLPLKMQNATVAAVNHFFIEILYRGRRKSSLFYAQFFLNETEQDTMRFIFLKSRKVLILFISKTIINKNNRILIIINNNSYFLKKFTMKKTALLFIGLLSFIALSLVSCDKDNFNFDKLNSVEATGGEFPLLMPNIL